MCIPQEHVILREPRGSHQTPGMRVLLTLKDIKTVLMVAVLPFGSALGGGIWEGFSVAATPGVGLGLHCP